MTASVDIDASLQDFTYTFTCGSRRERLSFHTCKPKASRGEREEILSIYGDREVQRQINGHEAVIENGEELRNVRSTLLTRNSLCGEAKSIRWKLYFNRDVNMKHCEDVFVGFCGLSLLESKLLSPHLYFRPEYQSKGIGKKVALCLSEKFLSQRDWLEANVSGLDITIHPMNEVCLLLKDKLFTDLAVENKNPGDVSGIWSKTHKFSKDKKSRTILLRKFVCRSIQTLELFWESQMVENVNRADALLLDNLEVGTHVPEVCSKKRHLSIVDSSMLNLGENPSMDTSGVHEDPSLESLDKFSKDLLRTIGPKHLQELLRPQKKVKAEDKDKLANDLDAALQAFSYTFRCGSRREKLSFRTYKGFERLSPGDHEEIRSIFGNRDVQFQTNGIPEAAQTEEEVENVRNIFVVRNSLTGEFKSVRWRLYYTWDIDANTPEEKFAGFVGLSLTDSEHLEPSVRLTPEYQKRGIATKLVFCVLHKLLQHKNWLFSNVAGLDMYIHPMNKASMFLKDKILADHAFEQRNSEDEDGIWSVTYLWFLDHKERTLAMRNFVCNNIQALETLWHSKMNQKVGWTELHLLNDLCVSEEAALVDDVINNVVDSTMEDSIQSLVLNQTMEKRLQDFTYSFKYKNKTEKLSFRTFQKAGQTDEVDTLLKLLGDVETTRHPCSETVQLDREQAVLLREHMREMNSFSVQGGMVWKLHYTTTEVKNCKEAFIGIIRLDTEGEYLLPEIYLLSEFRKMGCGTKGFVCLMLKMFCNKSWFMRNFKGIRVLVNPFNAGAIVLARKLLGPFGEEIRNSEREDELWVVRRSGFASPGGSEEMKMKRFECNGEAKLQSLLMSTARELRQNKQYVWQDKRLKQSVEVSQLASRVFFGLNELYVDPFDVKALVRKLKLQVKRNGADVPSVVSTFQLILPQLEDSPDSFFVLFFVDERGMHEFEVVLPHHRGRLRREFIAFSSVQLGNNLFRASVVEFSLECVLGCMIELDIRTFDFASNMTRSSVKGLWATQIFQYNKSKRRTVKQRFMTSLALKRVQI